jgi:periplasmic divalent cation tolerance protein
MELTTLRLVYMTARDKPQALAIGRYLVEQRLAACVNVLDGMTSVYQWQGKPEEASEVVLIAKTEARLVKALIAAVQSQHSYEVPCVLTLPILEGNPDYLAWLATGLV